MSTFPRPKPNKSNREIQPPPPPPLPTPNSPHLIVLFHCAQLLAGLCQYKAVKVRELKENEIVFLLHFMIVTLGLEVVELKIHIQPKAPLVLQAWQQTSSVLFCIPSALSNTFHRFLGINCFFGIHHIYSLVLFRPELVLPVVYCSCINSECLHGLIMQIYETDYFSFSISIHYSS